LSSTIIHQQKFELYLSQSQIEQKVQHLGKKLTEQYAQECPVILVILNGAFRFAADLIKELNFPLEIEFVRIASYQGTQSTGQIKEMLGQNLDLKGRTVLIVEDIVDTGHTYEYLQSKLANASAKSIAMATLLFKPAHYTLQHIPEYICFEIPDEFVVGYGLDYEQHGRELNDIYSLKQDIGYK